MSLSERERRLLAEMEAALATDDPRLESRLTGSTLASAKPHLILGALSIVGGLAILFSGLISKTTPLGVAGFIVALIGTLIVVRSFGKVSRRTTREKSPRASFSSRLEDRWNKRNFDR